MKDIKEKIADLDVLLRQVFDIKTQLNDLIEKTAMEYVRFERKKYSQFDYPSSEKCFDNWDFGSNGFVNINWSESWNYGGHADGIISFPISFLSNSGEFDKFKEDCIESEKQKITKEKNKERLRKEYEFERLKKELNKN